jgi:predicted ATPase/DNA-binding winged helix-turn-helix (wHTH) protein
MSTEARPVYVFGPFRLLPDERRLERDGQGVRLGGRAFDLLTVLVRHAGEVVPARRLLDEVWQDLTVDDSSLRVHVRALRKTLGEHPQAIEYIANVPGRGYGFVAPVERSDRAAPPAAEPALKPSLPARAGAIIGRADAIDAVCRELAQNRLVTVAGPAGVGKTTVAVAAAETFGEAASGGTCFVDLASVSAPSLVVGALAAALGVAVTEVDPVREVVRAVGEQPLLVVLDNCEQVIEAVAGLVERLLLETASVRLLATSREPLRVRGERVHRLAPLACPPVSETISRNEAMAYAAVQLFVERASAGGGDVMLDDAQAPAIAEICRRLDGIPLAIELAAARAEFFGVEALAQRLNDMFAVLTQGRRFALARHQTLRATLDWGYALLSPAEQAVLRRLSVFRSAVTLEAALAVVGPATDYGGAIEILANLVAKSLLTMKGAGDGVRYRLLEATRVYAGEKLAESDDEPTARLSHAEHHLSLLQAAPDSTDAAAARAWLAICAECLDDIRAALDWAMSPRGDQAVGLDLMAASARLWFQLSLNIEHRDRIEQVMQRLDAEAGVDPLVEMRLQIALGHAYWYSPRDHAKTGAVFERALALSDQLPDAPVHYRLQALWGMWATRRALGQYAAALAFAEQYEALAKAAGDAAFSLLGDRILGLTHHFLGDQPTAQRYMTRVLSVARSTPNPPNTDFQVGPEAAAAALMPRILWLQGAPDQARAALDAAIEAARRSDHWFSLYYVLGLSGCQLDLWSGDFAAAETHLAMMVNRSASDVWRQCWAFVLKLRRGGAEDGLIAAALEPRVDISSFSTIREMAGQAVLTVPQPDDEVGEALWNLPEVLRVNAELALWHGGPGAAAAAESRLLRALDLARRQSALSWELRCAMSLARLWRVGPRAPEARAALAGAYDRFTEGFDTSDLIEARTLIGALG